MLTSQIDELRMMARLVLLGHGGHAEAGRALLEAADAIEGLRERLPDSEIYAVGGVIAQAECANTSSDIAEFTCSVCKFNCNITSWVSLFDGDAGRHGNHHHGAPNYCPNCGRKVKR